MQPKILVASDSVKSAETARNVLVDEFENICVSGAPDKHTEDFDAFEPDVLILAFESIASAERYYLGIHRLSSLPYAKPHRTILLCSKDNVRQAYALCKKGHFDDYVLFWPLTYDAPRVAMSVHLAATALKNPSDIRDLKNEIGKHVATIGELEGVLQRRGSSIAQHTARITDKIASEDMNLRSRITELSGEVQSPGFGLSPTQVALIAQSLDRLCDDGIIPGLQAIAETTTPLNTEIRALQQELAPQFGSLHRLQELTSLPPSILAVDDDVFQHRMLRAVLAKESVELMCATTVAEAFSYLQRFRPDLILMDYDMPDCKGTEVVARLRATPTFSSVPIIMLTGYSGITVVRECLAAGANDFVVKPFDQSVLIEKIGNQLPPDSRFNRKAVH